MSMLQMSMLQMSMLQMSTMHALLAACFWCSTLAVLYAYLGYPLLIWTLARLFGRAPRPGPVDTDGAPRIALVIAAHNEAAVIEARIENALALDYPRDRLDIVIASDGSVDATPHICLQFGGQIRALLFPHRRGKAATLNAAVAEIDAEIVAFSDANTFMNPDALLLLARWFRDPAVGAVCGRLVLSDPQTGTNADGIYWRYETFLKRSESRLGALLGANGAIYAIRRTLFTPLPAGTVIDDFVIPLAARMRSGCRIVYDPEAIAHEDTAPDVRGEFHRRARIGVGGFQAIGFLWRLLSPRHGWTAFTFWSHKVLRWCCPLLLLAALGSAASLAYEPVYRAALGAQILFYAVCAAAAYIPPTNRACRILRVFPMFASMNLALLLGLLRWTRGNESGIWKRTERLQDLTQSV
ncbi:MAG: glycosyltransferase family 2 protein [Phycisphaerae bacterium]|nr:glycosyltransferase family 2 protein [Phycisphaerae bacterium]